VLDAIIRLEIGVTCEEAILFILRKAMLGGGGR
jgi:hypothetical protein